MTAKQVWPVVRVLVSSKLDARRAAHIELTSRYLSQQFGLPPHGLKELAEIAAGDPALMCKVDGSSLYFSRRSAAPASPVAVPLPSL